MKFSDKNNKNNKKPSSDDININERDSSVSEFVRRPLPNQKEIKRFEEKLHQQSRKEKEERMESGLSEIYKDKEGNMVNVKKIEKKKKGGVVSWFFFFLFLVLLLMGGGLGVFYYINHGGSNVTEVEFDIKGKDKVLANQEFSYVVQYNNPGNVTLENVEISVQYPERFVLSESMPEVSRKEAQKDIWEIGDLARGESGKIEITGRIIDSPDSSSIISATMDYTPSNFSSEFQKEASLSTQMQGSGLESQANFPDSVLVGETETLSLEVSPQEENYLESFALEIRKPDNMEILGVEWQNKDQEDPTTKITSLEDNSWNIINPENNSGTVEIEFRFTEKQQQKQDIEFLWKKILPQDREYVFGEEKTTLEIIKSNLDLNLIVNGSAKDQAVNFGEKLNYSITYANKGEAPMENVMIMAVLESQSLDWTTLETETSPTEKGNSLIWDQEEIPELKELEVGEKGSIDFSIAVSPFTGVEEDKKYEIKSYAQFVTNDNDSFDTGTSSTSTRDNISNTVINKINSDLQLTEEIRYFNENNIPVGSGPLPPQVGKETSFKVYWTLKNNLHELKNTRVKLELPEYVEWNSKKRTSVGSVDYNQEEHEVVWEVGRLPLAVYRADAEFSISLTPEEKDKNKIMVLSPGSQVEALDTVTQATVTDKTEAKTTKLEDDDIADKSSDGRIE